MTLFVGFEDMLKCVIENTAYVDNSQTGDRKTNKPDDERFHEAMQAIFGDLYQRPPKMKAPVDFELWQMLRLHKKIKETGRQDKAIRELVTALLKKPKKGDMESERQYAVTFDLWVDRLTKDYQRKAHLYEKLVAYQESGVSMSEDMDGLREALELEDERKQAMFGALRKAGWPI